MYQEEFMAVGQASIGKVNFLRKNPVGYFLASMLAGIYVGFGILLIPLEGNWQGHRTQRW